MDNSFDRSLGDGMVGINIYVGANSMAALNELAIDANAKSIFSLRM